MNVNKIGHQRELIVTRRHKKYLPEMILTGKIVTPHCDALIGCYELP